MPDTIAKIIQELDAVLAENRALRKEVERLKSSLNNRPKLNKKDVDSIRDLRRAGHNLQEIADIYDVNKSTISRTLRGIYH